MRGEGEQTIKEVVDAIENNSSIENIRGISFVKNRGIVHNPDREFIQDLDSIPMPAYELFNIKKYKVMSLISSRGCPYACKYCCAANFWKRRIRNHSVDRAIAEMKILHEKFEVKKFKFHDSTFTLDKQRVLDISKKIDENFYVTWSCEARADTLDEEMLRTMRKSGCVFVFIGVDSASLQVLDSIDRRMDIEKMEQAFFLAKKCNMSTKAYVAFGMPGETMESVEQTIGFLKRTKPDQIMLSLTTAYPGTDLYEDAKRGHVIKMPDQWLGMIGGHGRGALLYLSPTLQAEEYKRLAEHMLGEIKKIRRGVKIADSF